MLIGINNGLSRSRDWGVWKYRSMGSVIVSALKELNLLLRVKGGLITRK